MQSNCGLSDPIVDQVIDQLDGIFCDLNILFYMTLNFHWNMEDPRFIALHKFLDGQYHEMVELIDGVAERYRKLGCIVPASMKELANGAKLREPSGQPSGDEMLTILAEAHEHMIKKVRAAVQVTADLGDPGTADMLTAQLRWHEKQDWMLRSHL